MTPDRRRRDVQLLVLCASLRSQSLNRQLADLAAECLEAGGSVTTRANLAEFALPPYDQDVQDDGFPPSADALRDLLEAHDALVVVSPEYNGSMPGALKNAVDWLSRYKPQPFDERHCLLISASPSLVGGNRGLWALRVPLEHLGMRVYPDMFSLAQAHLAFANGSARGPHAARAARPDGARLPRSRRSGEALPDREAGVDRVPRRALRSARDARSERSAPVTHDTDRNRAATRRWFTAGWKGDLAYADQLFHRDFATNGEVVGPDGPKRNIVTRLAGFPDVETFIDEIVAVADTVVIRLHWTGTHRGPYSGVPPTGRTVDVRVISIWRFEDDRVVENWTVQDQFALLRQVGYLGDEITGAQVPRRRTEQGALP